MFSTFGNQLYDDRRLFRAEIRASIAHCNGLFRAGVLTRLEAERLKNGLWTILKRADFDRHFFDSFPAADIFSFVEARLFQLVNEAAARLQIGRNRAHQIAVALRLWLRDEIKIINEALENMIEALQATSENRGFAAFGESFIRDHYRFSEVFGRTNRMPCPQLIPNDELTAELDFVEVARELEFQTIIENSVDAAADRDFCVEFLGATALAMLHLSNLATEILGRLNVESAKRQLFEMIRGRAGKTFGYQTASLALLKGLSVADPAQDLASLHEIVFDAADTLKFSLTTITTNLKN